jgi:transcriptional regulator GlxA family with amidase domain
MPMDTFRSHRVAVLAMPGVVPYELGIPSRIFAAARDERGRACYQVETFAISERKVRTAFDFSIEVDNGVEVLDRAETLIVPTIHPLNAQYIAEEVVTVAVALLRTVPAGVRIVSFCTASYLLAAAGLLDGRTAATHWAFAEEFQRRFPQLTVDADALYVDTGDVLTSAGASAAVDLCLHLVRRDYGSEIANRAARSCVVPPWRDGGQAQYIERPMPEPAAASTAGTRSWALGRLHEPLSITELAGHARMSRRTFTRRFRDEVGLSPGQWLSRQRVELARQLLESSDLSVDQIARRVGFGTAVSMRQHLRAVLGVSPMAYRRTFQTTVPT